MIINEWNQAIMMKGFYFGGGPFYRICDQTLVTIHETLHTFSCDHLDYIRYIMSSMLADYIMHSQTISEINLTTYNGLGE
ncbi:hypothetical protein [Candidatus Hodarchaeum mangrovi]